MTDWKAPVTTFTAFLSQHDVWAILGNMHEPDAVNVIVEVLKDFPRIKDKIKKFLEEQS
jgi:hypothetical protein